MRFPIADVDFDTVMTVNSRPKPDDQFTLFYERIIANFCCCWSTTSPSAFAKVGLFL